IKQITKLNDDSFRVLASGIKRMEIDTYLMRTPYFEVSLKEFSARPSDPVLMEAVRRRIGDQLEKYKKLDNRIPSDAMRSLDVNDVKSFVGLMGMHLYRDDAEKQKLLETPDEYSQLEDIYSVMVRECEIMAVEKKINIKVRENIDRNQREYYLREQIKVIHDELGEDAEETEEYRRRAKARNLPEEVQEKIHKEIARMEKMSPTSPEAGVIRTYIEWLLDMPWAEESDDNLDLRRARQILDEDHYGLEKVKERIVEYLAVHQLTKNLKGPILCFVGPPGVGKTSVVSSIARASGRKLVSMSLGGVRDEAEIRGHRRTYIGALPGRIISGMKQADVINPVFLLDEIDKMSSDFRGDPASAMLEVLDPNQNNAFKDHYLEVAYDLSKVMFVTTANSLDTIPAPLLDRMEVIELSGYTYEEKLQIAKRYLVPKQLEANGLTDKQASVSDATLMHIISGYTRESGVRNLEREIGTVIRKIAVKVVENGVNTPQHYAVKPSDLKEYLGVVKYKDDLKNEADESGFATGLAWTSVGGVTLNIEVAIVPGGKGEIILTGSLGDVMKESCRTALTLVRTRAEQYGIEPDKFTTCDLHIHVPEGATPKDGPSAGITMATAILSAFSNRKVSRDVAMTGEVTLRGKVLPIGGLKEKSLAAFRAGVKTLIIPYENKKDAEELPDEVKNNVKILCAKTIDEVFRAALL
ncbi:MAG: endopeptidase La, partial [Clostridiales bacterium]|nr:endopeptidase La [Clostridiales bacterium]